MSKQETRNSVTWGEAAESRRNRHRITIIIDERLLRSGTRLGASGRQQIAMDYDDRYI